jgi:5-methyltetrahydrofolate--homocysteine methyltransferase
LKPLGNLDFNDAYEAFTEVVRAGCEADVIIIETMSDLYELKAAVLAAKEHFRGKVYATVTLDEKGKLLTGSDIAGVVALLEGLRVDALGLNCSLAPSQVVGFAAQFLKYSSLPVIISPNAGLPMPDGSYDNISPKRFAADMKVLAEMGVSILGGCCGTTPEHLREMINAVKDVPIPPVNQKHFTVVSSGCKSVVWSEKPVIIGERLNPTGKPKLKHALTSGDTGYILREALAQNNADILDVNVGLPELDERAAMTEAILEIQGVSDLPLQIDSADPEVIGAALRVYNGKAMINSVNGKRESMDAVFPLAAKYGGVVVALTLDENGIPDTAEGRISIAKRIVETASEYGLLPKDIVIDALTLSVGANPNEAKTTLETVRALTAMGLKTILGVSNVSFGMPNRDRLNAAFYTMALNSGLSSAIINPCSENMLGAYNSYCTLVGIEANKTVEAAATEEMTLYQSVQSGVILSAESAASRDKRVPEEIINTEIIPALDFVGKDFESGKIFLPQLLRSAEAAQAAFAVLRERMGGVSTATKCKIVIATVKGDVHDIGKNIAKVILSNYGYEVIDLGKDVPPEEVVKAALEHGAPFVGLSALMTTTVKSMELTIRMLKDAGYTGKIIVSGAVMNAEYAAMVGADKYVADAGAAAGYMELK